MLLLHLIYQQKAHLDRLLVEAVQALSMNRGPSRNAKDNYLEDRNRPEIEDYRASTPVEL